MIGKRFVGPVTLGMTHQDKPAFRGPLLFRRIGFVDSHWVVRSLN